MWHFKRPASSEFQQGLQNTQPIGQNTLRLFIVEHLIKQRCYDLFPKTKSKQINTKLWKTLCSERLKTKKNVQHVTLSIKKSIPNFLSL